MTIAVVAAGKGGVAKSTTAGGLASIAAETGREVHGIDLDPQQTTVEWMPDLFVAAPHITEPDELLDLAATYSSDALVVVDTPPGGTPGAIAGMRASDVLIAPTALFQPDMRALGHLSAMSSRDARLTLHAMALEALRTRYGAVVTVAVPMSSSVGWAQATHERLPWLSPPAVAYRTVYERLVQVERAAVEVAR